MGLSAILNIAQGALQASQTGMEVISHNIANVNTPGYTRQQLDVTAANPVDFGRLRLGMGVAMNNVTQAFDPYTTRAIQQNTSSLQEYDAEAAVLSHLEGLFNESGEGSLAQILNEFWNAWQDLASNPGGTVERAALLEKAKILVQKFNSMSNDLAQTQKDMNTNLLTGIQQVNDLTGKIAALNEQIVAAEADGTSANDLRDQRNNLLEELSGWLGNVSLEQGNGSVTVRTEGGALLVDGNRNWEFSTQGDSIYYNGIETDVSQDLTGGKIGGWLDVRDEIIPQSQANLDELAGTLIRQVNALHSTGYTLSGETGINFFDDSQVPLSGDNTDAASYIQLSAEVQDDLNNIAAGGQSGAPGDNENALKILALQTDGSIQIRKWTITDRGETASSALETTSLEDYYRTLVGEIGTATEAASENKSFVQSMVDALQSARDSVSGVNLDEELTQLLKVQRAYEASAKIIAVVDEMLQSLMDIK